MKIEAKSRLLSTTHPHSANESKSDSGSKAEEYDDWYDDGDASDDDRVRHGQKPLNPDYDGYDDGGS